MYVETPMIRRAKRALSSIGEDNDDDLEAGVHDRKGRRYRGSQATTMACISMLFLSGLIVFFLWVGHSASTHNDNTLRTINSRLDAIAYKLNNFTVAEPSAHVIAAAVVAPPPPQAVALPQCRKMIFVASSGHSGNVQLFDLMSLLGAGKLDLYYQAPPSMAGSMLMNLKKEGYANTYSMRKEVKIPSMQQQVRNGSAAWMDTSHLFIAWYDVALDYWVEQCDEVYVLVLRRYAPHVIHELVQEGFQQHEQDWYHTASSSMGLIPPRPPSPPSALDDILWYLVDVEQRIQQIKRKYANAGARFIDIRIEELSKKSSLIRLINSLGLSQDLRSNSLPASASRSIAAATPHLSIDEEKEYIKAMEDFLSLYTANGIQTPDMSSLITNDRL